MIFGDMIFCDMIFGDMIFSRLAADRSHRLIEITQV